jgi:pyridoxal phosphate enzyme (YggS family)
LKLAEEINKRASQHNIVMPILIQVDMANEAQKFGIDTDQLKSLLNSIKELKSISVKGLMFIAPFVDNPEEVRIHFKAMKELFDELKSLESENIKMEELSMGMTGDFEVAIEEGATMIRVGTGIYGKRNYG